MAPQKFKIGECSYEDLCEYEKIRIANIAERKVKFEELEITNAKALVKSVKASAKRTKKVKMFEHHNRKKSLRYKPSRPTDRVAKLTSEKEKIKRRLEDLELKEEKKLIRQEKRQIKAQEKLEERKRK